MNGTVEIAGPKRAPFHEFIARYLVGDAKDLYFGGHVEQHSLVPLGEARLGRVALDECLRRPRTAT